LNIPLFEQINSSGSGVQETFNQEGQKPEILRSRRVDSFFSAMHNCPFKECEIKGLLS
jgi:hypothetical protein